ncbi:hypothetical protein [Clostridium neonatale]|uniref:hypothetical protein n=1 Tax=Clostridium neonatale TaxID=137838 RepID=UPI00291BBB6B|nr:hypothetical protein [Clostridium neonatale]CAI3570716.1 conserved hypothetical protein [Clostridium neonatale]CAI3656398.1 conserved hypothetical protein [Clostridium neonatale]CAI3705116.1 conserved hypothetical protein [Clostridium neonatale]CAI3713539.1 conserved hypothetical protein [Clostridium neonatale]
MTVFYLQEDLIDELKKVFKGFKLKDPYRNESDINIFSQNLPLINIDEEEEPFPYIIVRVTEGAINDIESEQELTTQLLVGIYDDSQEANGHKDILNIIQKIHERFFKNNILANKYVMQTPFKWVLQEEDTNPYYFGGIEVSWKTRTIEKEDKFA